MKDDRKVPRAVQQSDASTSNGQGGKTPYRHVMAAYDVELRGDRAHVDEVLRLVGKATDNKGDTGRICVQCGVPWPLSQGPRGCKKGMWCQPGTSEARQCGCGLPARPELGNASTPWCGTECVASEPRSVDPKRKARLTDDNLDELEDYARGGEVPYGPCALILDALDELRFLRRESVQPDTTRLLAGLKKARRQRDAVNADNALLRGKLAVLGRRPDFEAMYLALRDVIIPQSGAVGDAVLDAAKRRLCMGKATDASLPPEFAAYDAQRSSKAPLMCPEKGIPCLDAWKQGCGQAGYACMSEADREARAASIVNLGTEGAQRVHPSHLQTFIDLGRSNGCTCPDSHWANVADSINDHSPECPLAATPNASVTPYQQPHGPLPSGWDVIEHPTERAVWLVEGPWCDSPYLARESFFALMRTKSAPSSCQADAISQIQIMAARAIRQRATYMKTAGYSDGPIQQVRHVALWLESTAGRDCVIAAMATDKRSAT